jgi:hypothetical protein
LLVPVVGILLARRLEEWGGHQTRLKTIVSFSMIGVAGLLAVATMHADYAWSNTARLAARDITSKYDNIGKVWFQGHWGFQYYMEESGAQPMDFTRNNIQPGEYLVIPVNNSNAQDPDDRFDLVEVMRYQHGSFLAIMNSAYSAGFYSSYFGAMPYSLKKPTDEVYLIFRRNNRG